MMERRNWQSLAEIVAKALQEIANRRIARGWFLE